MKTRIPKEKLQRQKNACAKSITYFGKIPKKLGVGDKRLVVDRVTGKRGDSGDVFSKKTTGRKGKNGFTKLTEEGGEKKGRKSSDYYLSKKTQPEEKRVNPRHSR